MTEETKNANADEPVKKTRRKKSDAAASMPAANDRNIAMLAHLLGFVTSIFCALIIWITHKDDEDKVYVNEQAKEALNFQIFMGILFIASLMLIWVGIGLFMLPVVFLSDAIFCLVAAIAASKGKDYRYPLSLRLVH